MLARGARLTELLKQDQYAPLPMEEQVVAIYAGVRGYLDAVEPAGVTRFEERLLALVRNDHADLLAAIRDDGEIGDETEARLKAVLDGFADSAS